MAPLSPMLAKIRERLKQPSVEVRWVSVTTATRLPHLTNGSIDIECGVTSCTAAHQAKAAFSMTIFVQMRERAQRVQAQPRRVGQLIHQQLR